MLKVTDYKLKTNQAEQFNLVGKVKVGLLMFLAPIAIFLLFAQLVFASNLSVEGQRLSEISEEIQELEAQNTTLSVEIAKSSSLHYLSYKAQKLGFINPSKILLKE